MLQCSFANVEITSINVRRLNFYFQPDINVEATLMNVDNQRCFNVDVFPGKDFNKKNLEHQEHSTVKDGFIHNKGN